MTAISLNRHIWRAIGEFVGAPEDLTRAARTSQAWKAQVYEQIFGAFLTSYAQEPVLAEKITHLAHLPNEAARMGALFKEILVDGHKCWQWSPRTLYPPARLSFYQELRAISLVNFLKRLADKIPEAEIFLATLKEEDPQKAEKVKAWLHANKQLLEKRTWLNCSGGDFPIYVMPDEIELFSGATELRFEWTMLIALSSKIGCLQNLCNLLLDRNHFTHLPATISSLSQLQRLQINQGWRITSLPENLEDLKALTELSIRENELTSLPNSICQLTALKRLDLWRNKLRQLPPDIGNLSELESLKVQENQLTSLPDSIGSLTNLETLNIQLNKLTTLPQTLVSLTKLKQFESSGNPLKEVPDTLKTCEIAAIRDDIPIALAHAAKMFLAEPPPIPPPPPPLSFWEQAQEFFYACFCWIKETLTSFLRLLFPLA